MANEIVANLKMIVLAIILSLVFMAGFWIYHLNDRKPIEDLHDFGTSCYDNYSQFLMSSNYCGEHIGNYIIVCNGWGADMKYDSEWSSCKKAYISDTEKEMINEISSIRELFAKEDFEDHLKYTIIISLALTILGRYLIKGSKWVAKNKTK